MKLIQRMILAKICGAMEKSVHYQLHWKDRRESDITLIIMVGESVVGLLDYFFNSINEYWEYNPSKIIVVSDGSIQKDKILKILEWVPRLRVFDIVEIYNILNTQGRVELCAAKKLNPDARMLDKLAIISAFDDMNRIYCDLDILWKKCPFEALQGSKVMCMAEDIRHSYDWEGFSTPLFEKLKSQSGMNAGFLYLQKEWYKTAKIKEIVLTKITPWSHLSEQTLVTMAFFSLKDGGHDVSRLERPWMTFGNEGFWKKLSSNAACIHYTAGSRWDIFIDGFLQYLRFHPMRALKALFTR